jgi:hypothetical protein
VKIITDSRKWHKWFAWYPVKVRDGGTVWFEIVYRRTRGELNYTFLERLFFMAPVEYIESEFDILREE